MAKYGSSSIGFFLVGGYSVLGYQTELETGVEKLTEQTDVLGDSWVAHSLTGIRQGVLKQTGFYDDVAAGNNELLVGAGASRVVCLNLTGNTAGNKFMGYAGAFDVKYTRNVSRGALHKAVGEYRVSGEVEEGTILQLHVAKAAVNSPSNSVDNSAGTSNGGAGYLQVSSLTLGGYTSVTVKIQHSTDNSSWSDLVTFTNVTAAQTAERKTAASTVNRYLRVSWVFNGSGSSESITLMAGFYRNP